MSTATSSGAMGKRRLMGKTGFLAVSVLFLVVLSSIVGQGEAGETWKVKKQTKDQKIAYESLTATAKEASENATPALLAYLDSPEFRGNISNLPEEIKSLSSEELLKLLNDTLLLSTVTHGIPAEFDPVNDFFDVSLEEIISMNLTFIANLWERFSIGELSENSTLIEVIAKVENLAEVEVFLLPNFTSPWSSLPLNQSQNRISYGALNIFRGAAGAQFYGPVQFVLRPEYYEDMLIVAPYDTGNYAFCCLSNQSAPPGACIHDTFPNGSCPKIALGTARHWNHLYFQNQRYWEFNMIIDLVQRLFAKPEPELSFVGEVIYFEADVLGNLILPDSVQYVLGDFSNLFGKPAGQMVMGYCAAQGLPLVWALGAPNINTHQTNTSGIVVPMNQSLFDPTILSLNITGMPNVTASSASIEWFQETWQLVNTSLIENPAAQNSSAFWIEVWNKFWNNLQEVHFNLLFPGNCEDVKHCFGVDDFGVCYCRYPKDSSSEDLFEDSSSIANRG